MFPFFTILVIHLIREAGRSVPRRCLSMARTWCKGARCDMITYWLAQLESSAFNVIHFVQIARYEQAARLTIVPAPHTTIHVFLAFR